MASFGEIGRGQKSEDAEAIVDGDEDDALEWQKVAVVARLVAAAAGVAAAMNPEHDRQLALVVGVGGRIDVQKEAILAGSSVLEDHVVEDAALGAVRAILGGVALALPLCRRLGCLPAQVADRRSRIGQSEKRFHLAVIDGLAVQLCPVPSSL